jgi:hypothetical protein
MNLAARPNQTRACLQAILSLLPIVTASTNDPENHVVCRKLELQPWFSQVLFTISAMRNRFLRALCSFLLSLSVVHAASAAPGHFTETWESYATGVTPYGPWELEAGAWGTLLRPDADGAGYYHATPPGQTVWLRRTIDLRAHDHVVLQGWFYDSATANNRSALGFARTPAVNNASLLRMGAPSSATTYRLEYHTSEGGEVSTVDSLMARERGWHFMRLDLVRDRLTLTNWNGTWRVWNAAATNESKRTFVWAFDATNVNWVTVGSGVASAGQTGWDDIQVGSLAEVGPPPALPQATPAITAVASSFINSDWAPSKVLDGSAHTVFSSNGHGSNSNASEWVSLRLPSASPLSGVTITARPGGYCWPINYVIETSLDFVTWTPVPGLSFTNQAPPASPVTHAFSPPINTRGVRLRATRLGPDNNGNRYLQIGDMMVAGFDPAAGQPWASPAELRGKKVINGAQYSTLNLHEENAPLPKFLADHPEYLANHPFDGLSVPIRLDRQWLTNQGLLEAEYALQDLVMTKLPIPWSQVSDDVDDLKRVQWAHVTDNFLWYRVSDASQSGDFDKRYAVDPASTNDWAIVAQNAALCARLCRESGLKGFIVDTEQYTKYASGEEYPFGRGTAATWRERGRQWIEAVQSEFPGITMIFFFSWGPETEPGGWQHYGNLKQFMDGILAGVQSPARIIHGWESTFWWGGQRFMGGDQNDPKNYNHYPGNRTDFAGARNDIKNVWRNLSGNPTKYDQFVEAGMAAYADSDPFNLWPGWPSGYLTDWPWSNLPYTLAYSDSYVWVWAGHTHYAATRDVLNPFMASIANRTFNTGREVAAHFTEEFQTDPMSRGWHFDFDMLGIGRRRDQDHQFPFLPAMSLDSVAYAWSAAEKGVKVRANWTRGDFGEIAGLAGPQRRRYVRPITPLTASDAIRFSMDFTVETFGTAPANPILLGLFHSTASTSNQAFALRMTSASDARIVVAGDGPQWTVALPLTNALPVGTRLRCSLDFQPRTRALQAVLRAVASGAVLGQTNATLSQAAGPFVVDEAGIAQVENAFATPAASAHRFRLDRFALREPGPTLSLPPGNLDASRPLLIEGVLPGITYTAWVSRDLTDWEPFTNFTAGAPGSATIEIIVTGDQRFYRVGP